MYLIKVSLYVLVFYIECNLFLAALISKSMLNIGVPGMVKIPRPPGCNGGVCYCNHYDYCNDRFKKNLKIKMEK